LLRQGLYQFCGIVHGVSLRSDGGRQLLSYRRLPFFADNFCVHTIGITAVKRAG
jgi:hypothetical protein